MTQMVLLTVLRISLTLGSTWDNIPNIYMGLTYTLAVDALSDTLMKFILKPVFNFFFLLQRCIK